MIILTTVHGKPLSMTWWLWTSEDEVAGRQFASSIYQHSCLTYPAVGREMLEWQVEKEEISDGRITFKYFVVNS